MAQFSYDVVPHDGGWAILVTLGQADAFPTKQAAYDVAVGVCPQAAIRRLRVQCAGRARAGEEGRQRALKPRADVPARADGAGRDKRAGGWYLRS